VGLSESELFEHAKCAGVPEGAVHFLQNRLDKPVVEELLGGSALQPELIQPLFDEGESGVSVIGVAVSHGVRGGV